MEFLGQIHLLERESPRELANRQLKEFNKQTTRKSIFHAALELSSVRLGFMSTQTEVPAS